MQNGESTDEIKSVLEEANNEAKKYLTKEVLSENSIIAVWREAYRKFKTKKSVRALDYISENSKKYLNADVEKYILDINNPEITLK